MGLSGAEAAAGSEEARAQGCSPHLGGSHGGHAPAAEELQVARIVAGHVVLRERRAGHLRRAAGALL